MSSVPPSDSGPTGPDGSGGTRSRRRRRPLEPIEWVTLIHVSVYIVAATWAFGGQSDWVRGPLTVWGASGTLITLAVLLRREPLGRGRSHPLWWALPMLAFNAIVLIAATNPSLREVLSGGDRVLVASGGRPTLPSSARPLLARQALWQFDAIWISCFNILLVLKRRRALRALLIVVVLNALALAVFGTVQKLAGATGIYFGSVPSPQKYFFASFVYHNHWGAFMVLCVATCLALSAHYLRYHVARDFLHSPALMGFAVVLILAATIPLSASRSGTLVATLLLGGAVLYWLARLVRKRRHYNESIVPPIAIATVVIALSVGAIAYLGRDTISARLALTREQLHHARNSRAPDQRVRLYRDTWEMARAKPWFGWGMASYPHVFTIYNTQAPIPHFPVFFHDAHSDWLQSLAEHGWIGTACLLALVALPLTSIRGGGNPLTGFTLYGCAAVVLYAALEFPFGNYSVQLLWWLCFYTAVQFARQHRLERKRDSTGASTPSAA